MENEKHDRYEKWKQEAVEYGMKMVEAERKRSDEEHAVLLKRIAFLTEELEETRRQLRTKNRECEELAEVAEQLSSHCDATLNASCAGSGCGGGGGGGGASATSPTKSFWLHEPSIAAAAASPRPPGPGAEAAAGSPARSLGGAFGRGPWLRGDGAAAAAPVWEWAENVSSLCRGAWLQALNKSPGAAAAAPPPPQLQLPTLPSPPSPS